RSTTSTRIVTFPSTLLLFAKFESVDAGYCYQALSGTITAPVTRAVYTMPRIDARCRPNTARFYNLNASSADILANIQHILEPFEFTILYNFLVYAMWKTFIISVIYNLRSPRSPCIFYRIYNLIFVNALVV
ncbi:hypothetical protein ROZALSC1DRAFT_23260, partial [Rozella allomycis CSF55]